MIIFGTTDRFLKIVFVRFWISSRDKKLTVAFPQAKHNFPVLCKSGAGLHGARNMSSSHLQRHRGHCRDNWTGEQEGKRQRCMLSVSQRQFQLSQDPPIDAHRLEPESYGHISLQGSLSHSRLSHAPLKSGREDDHITDEGELSSTRTLPEK